MLSLHEYRWLYERADRQRQFYAEAEPFPHAVFHDFLPTHFYDEIADCFPAPDSAIWKQPENEHTRAKMVTKRGDLDLKESLYSDAARRAFMELNSGMFLRFLENLTGIDGLIPDPYFAEGGFHCTGNGGKLDIHADFSHNDKLGLERRVNLLLYLNDGWKTEYGGELGLYDTDLKCVASVLPLGNTAVVFTTSDNSYHGHPEPMRLPEGVYRKSIALYYYSLPRHERCRSRILFPEDSKFTNAVTQD